MKDEDGHIIVDHERISALMDSYGLADEIFSERYGIKKKISEELSLVLFIEANECRKVFREKNTCFKEVAEFIQFLRTCEGSDINITGYITHPQGKQIKGSILGFNLSDKSGIISAIELFCNTFLEYEQEDFYQEEFGWKEKGGYINDMGDEHDYLKEPFSNDELNKIVNLYDGLEEGKNLKKNAKLGRVVEQLQAILCKCESYTKWTDTKKYSFIYDIMLESELAGKEGYLGDGAFRDKYQKVRDWIKSYYKQREKK